jgi:hypothetical protein
MPSCLRERVSWCEIRRDTKMLLIKTVFARDAPLARRRSLPAGLFNLIFKISSIPARVVDPLNPFVGRIPDAAVFALRAALSF